MELIFDKGKATERRLEVDTINERPLSRKMIGSSNIKIEKEEDFPEIDGFKAGDTFSTLEAKSGGIYVPIIGTYNVIEDFTAAYDERASLYIINIVMGWVESRSGTTVLDNEVPIAPSRGVIR